MRRSAATASLPATAPPAAWKRVSPGFSTHDVRFGTRLTQRIDLHVGVENLGAKW